MSTKSRAGATAGILSTLLVLAALVTIGHSFSTERATKQAIEKWIKNYPVDVMVIEKHPNTYDRFFQHFRPYYAQMGEAGLAQGQMELQQIFNVNYLTDYIWTVKDAEIKEYVRTQLALVDQLLKAQGTQNGLCEQYFGNSALFSKVNEAAGGSYFAAYMQASEKLMLSARDGVEFRITPKAANYFMAVNAADAAFWQEFGTQHPELTQEGLQRAASLFDPLRSCAGFAQYLRALYNMPSGFMSLYWRNAMEKQRPQFEAIRRLHGSE